MIEIFLTTDLIFGLTILHVVIASLGIYAVWMIKVALFDAEEISDE